MKPAVAVAAIGAAGIPGQPGNGAHHPVRSRRRQLANGVVARVRHIEIAAAVHRNAIRAVKPRVAVGAIGAAGIPGQPGDGAYHPVCSRQRQLADGMIIQVRHINVGVVVHGNAPGIVKKCGAPDAVRSCH